MACLSSSTIIHSRFHLGTSERAPLAAERARYEGSLMSRLASSLLLLTHSASGNNTLCVTLLPLISSWLQTNTNLCLSDPSLNLYLFSSPAFFHSGCQMLAPTAFRLIYFLPPPAERISHLSLPFLSPFSPPQPWNRQVLHIYFTITLIWSGPPPKPPFYHPYALWSTTLTSQQTTAVVQHLSGYSAQFCFSSQSNVMTNWI